jgi:hypothetical protein
MHGICASNNPSRADQLKKALPTGSPDLPGFTPRCDSRCNSRLGPLQRSTRGQMHVQRLRAALELSRTSADIPSDSSLNIKTKTTNRED